MAVPGPVRVRSSFSSRDSMVADTVSRPAPLWGALSLPAELAICFLDRQVVDAGEAPAHQAVLGELPVLVAVGAEPVPRVVVPLVLEAHGDEVAHEAPELLLQPVVELAVPLA